MTDKSNFTSVEWKLLESLTMVGIAVTAAEPSGRWGLLKESFANSSPLVPVRLDPGAKPAHQVGGRRFCDRGGAKRCTRRPEGKAHGRKPAEIKAQCIKTCHQVAAAIRAKAPADAAAFKGWLRQVSQHVAEVTRAGADFSGSATGS